MKMLMVVYNEALDIELMELLEGCKIKGYTKIKGALGKGTASGAHLGTDTWPGLNNILYAACGEKDAEQLISRVKELRKQLGHEGIKAFLMPLEEIT